MNIDRHNYETFFLLYVDNELSATERKAVELFVSQNPDLQMELELLLGTTLSADNIEYSGRKDLYKNEGNFELTQQQLILELDAELNEADSKLILSAIATDAATNKEWQILSQTKLDSKDKIVFEDKASLYRHEQRPVIALRVWRIVAAAAILIALLVTGIAIVRNSGSIHGKDEIVITPSVPVPQIKKDNKSNADKFSDPKATELPPENLAHQNKLNNSGDKDQKLIDPSTSTKEHVVNNDVVQKPKPQHKEEALKPTQPLENINRQEGNETVTSNVTNKRSEIVIVNEAPDEVANVTVKDKITAPSIPLTDYNQIAVKPDSYATAAVFNEASENDTQILYMSEERINRSKLGGFIRKVKRVIERNTNIKTSNGLKIGGFEIAVK